MCRNIRAACVLLAAMTLTSCNASTTIDAGVSRAESAADATTQRAKAWLCNHQSLRSFRENFPTPQQKFAISALCGVPVPAFEMPEPASEETKQLQMRFNPGVRPCQTKTTRFRLSTSS